MRPVRVEKLAQFVADRAHDTEPHRAGHAPGRLGRLGDAPVDRVVGGAQIVAQLLTQGRQRDRAAGALEQRPADAALLGLDRPESPGFGHSKEPGATPDRRARRGVR
ncbi:hypothetical protein ACFPIJ_61690 [Dactylosporangium cerinum]|uniref:Uncharacterized protein n=1 Tax=Dactylosporangium cerinum TaxID=1434730 RepID=A0ABV9WHJ4_9ACTN